MKKLFTIATLGFLSITTANAGDMRQYDVSITNATTHHVFTPVLIATHKKNLSLFNIGEAASEGLALQAETGDPSLLQAETQSHYGVTDTVIGGFIPYGQTATYSISADKRSRLSLTTMLATTNDGFAGLNSVILPRKSVTYYAYVYDAGSEANNEDCAFIPGPPCAPDSGNSRDTAGAEGFVSIHNGIYGHGNLNQQQLDWRGPVAVITITRTGD